MSLETRGAADAAAGALPEEGEESEEEELGDFFLRFCRPSPLPIKRIVVVVVVNNGESGNGIGRVGIVETEKSATPPAGLLLYEKDEEKRQAKNAALADGMVLVVDMLAGNIEAMAETIMKNRGKRPSLRKILVVFLPSRRLRIRFIIGKNCWTTSSSS
jgi:hypothetical protein